MMAFCGTHHALLRVLLLLHLWASERAPGVDGSRGTEEAEAVQFACNPKHARTAHFPFCNTLLDASARVADLVGRLTLEEKAGQLINNAPAISRLGIPAYDWWGEGLHGSAESPGTHFGGSTPCATVFPQVLGTAASFNSTLWYTIAKAVSTESRAIYRAGRGALTLWAPNINIFRDPRWGRGQETPGEDPLVSARYAGHYVRGLQGDADIPESEWARPAVRTTGPAALKVSAGCKHFTAYDLEGSNGTDRFRFDAKVTEQDLGDTYQVPFRACIERGRASGLMCAYNLVNGVPMCASKHFLTDVARDSWGLDGYVTTDCGAIYAMWVDSKFSPSPEAALAAAVAAGMDLNCGTTMRDYTVAAVRAGYLREADLEPALTHLFAVRMRLGMFDGDPRLLRWGDLTAEAHVIDSPGHQQLALEAARQSIVLLKNDGGRLPLARGSLRTVAAIGPHANASSTLLGNYHGPPCRIVTPVQGLAAHAEVAWEPGCTTVACRFESRHFAAAASAAARADVAIVFVGLDASVEGESLDRESLLLPGHQEDLVAAAAATAKDPIVVVVFAGGPVDLSRTVANPSVAAIVWAGYPGQAGGTAVAEVLFGDHNPGGRLPMTWYPESFAREVSMLDMRMRSDPLSGYPGRSHRFYTGAEVFRFGHGLSYSRFSYLSLSAPAFVSVSHTLGSSPLPASSSSLPHRARSAFSVRVVVANAGPLAGEEAVLLYLKPPCSTSHRPTQVLIGFKKVALRAGEQIEVVIQVNVRDALSVAQSSGDPVFLEGECTLRVGELERTLAVIRHGVYGADTL